VESIFPPQSGLLPNIGINLGSIMLPDVATELKSKNIPPIGKGLFHILVVVVVIVVVVHSQ